jgi:hypothetical protein
MSTWLIVYWMLSAYCLAGCLMEHFAVFSGWKAVGAGQFQAVQTAQGHGSGVVYVIPKTLLTVMVITLLAGTPPIPAWPLWGSIAALATSWVSFFVIQLPIQLLIRRTADQNAISRLHRTDWIRVLAMIVHFGFVIVTISEALT